MMKTVISTSGKRQTGPTRLPARALWPTIAAMDHKISVPQAHPDALVRASVLDGLFGNPRARVVLFQGPAGHGKTTLMLQAEAKCRDAGLLTAWVSIDGSDNDLPRLASALQQALSALQASPDSPAFSAAEADANAIRSRADRIAIALQGLDHPAALFLDDLHELDALPVLAFLRELLIRLPPAVRIFLSSRTVPDLGLSRLVVNGEAMIVRAAELCFSLEETNALFAQDSELQLSDEEITNIHRATEGWPAGLQLYRLALADQSVRGTLRHDIDYRPTELTNYLAENVLSRQEPAVRSFLCETAHLARLSTSLCNAVLDRDDSHEHLAYLEKTGLFVRRLESAGQWFTYHALFADFLREHLQSSDPNAVALIHRRAAAWFDEQAYPEEAMHHYSAAGRHGAAADVFELWSDRLVLDGHMVTVDRWANRIPIRELRSRPGLVVKIVWALAFLSRHRKLEPMLPLLDAIDSASTTTANPAVAASMVAILNDDLARAERIVSAIDTKNASGSSFELFELSAVENARGYTAMAGGRLDHALEHLALGRILSERAGAAFSGAYSTAKTAITKIAQGRLPEALVQFESALADAQTNADDSVTETSLVCGYIMARYERGNFDGVPELFARFRDSIRNAAIHDYLAVAYVAVARIHDLNSDPDAALAILDEAERIAYAGQWPRVISIVAWERVHREIAAGRIERAAVMAGWIPDAGEDDPAWVRFSEETGGAVIGSIRLMIHRGEGKAALKYIATHLHAAVEHGRVLRQIKLQTLAALAHDSLGQAALAHRALESALQLAASGGYSRCFLDEGPLVETLLLAHLRAAKRLAPVKRPSEIHEFLESLVAAVGAELASPVPALTGAAKAAAEPFTEREEKVLSLLLDYMSNDEIAKALFVTRDTVKYHLKNIYGKLGARNRLDAIRIASGS